jgi:hypothetical protein
MKVEISYLEASQLLQRQNLVGGMFGEKLKYAISKNILHLTSMVKEYRNLAMSQKNDHAASFIIDEKKFNDQKLQGKELEDAKVIFDEKHKKYHDRNKEIDLFRRELTNKVVEFESHECKVADFPEDIRKQMNVEQELYLISIGVISEPLPPSAGLISV